MIRCGLRLQCWIIPGLLVCLGGCQGRLRQGPTPPAVSDSQVLRSDAQGGAADAGADGAADLSQSDAAVRPFVLGLPLACEPGEDCAIAYYFDHGAGRDLVNDYACGKRALDGHKATTFVLRDAVQMAAGVSVVAAEAGEVVALDTDADCGVGVTLDHGEQWRTRYCHLMPESLEVIVGDLVGRGQRMGNVGRSGATEQVAQLGFEVLHDGIHVDPFSGTATPPTCGDTSGSLWTAQARSRLPYAPQLIQFGFIGELIDTSSESAIEQLRTDIFAGSVGGDTLSPSDEAMLLYLQVFGLEQGDSFRTRIVAPDGEPLLASDWQVLTRGWVVYTHLSGLRRTSVSWPLGRYSGEVEIQRRVGTSDPAPILKNTTVLVEP